MSDLVGNPEDRFSCVAAHFECLRLSIIVVFIFETKICDMSHPMGKPTICIGENKGADQLRGNREADQRLCFHYTDSTIPLLLKSEISSF